jgi:methionyl-tRNA formyltransferase
MTKKIAILISDDAHHQYLASLLISKLDVVAVVIEPGAKQRQRLFHRGCYIDYLYGVYHNFRRKILGINAYRHSYFAQTVSVLKPSSCRSITVDWINDPSVLELLLQTAPDLTVVMGTSILHKQLLQTAGEIILNIHGGYLPDYRGNHCFFFAIYHDRLDKIGSTIHFVDPGVDTGDIVEVVVPPIYPEDFQSVLKSAEVLYCRAEMLAIHRLIGWIEHYQNGGQLPRIPQNEKGRLYRTRDRHFYHELILWLRQFKR